MELNDILTLNPDALRMEDEWVDPSAMKDAFERALRGPIVRGNSAETIDYTNLKVSEEVDVDKTIRSDQR